MFESEIVSISYLQMKNAKYAWTLYLVAISMAGFTANAQCETTEPDMSPRVVLEKNGVKYAYPHWSVDNKRILL